LQHFRKNQWDAAIELYQVAVQIRSDRWRILPPLAWPVSLYPRFDPGLFVSFSPAFSWPLYLTKLVFLFANHEDRAGRRTHYAFGCAADAEMLPSGVPLRCKDHKIDIKIFGSFHDFMRR
jgi:hypothetical protein